MEVVDGSGWMGDGEGEDEDEGEAEAEAEGGGVARGGRPCCWRTIRYAAVTKGRKSGLSQALTASRPWSRYNPPTNDYANVNAWLNIGWALRTSKTSAVSVKH